LLENATLINWLLTGLLLIWPLGRIFARAGLPSWRAAVVLIPGIGVLLALALLVFARWPTLPPPPPPRLRKARVTS
jgi:hypothetical protein